MVAPVARLAAIGLVVDDMARSLAFYRALGLELDGEADAEQHAEVTLAGGIRLMWDTAAMASSIDPAWTPPGGGHRVALAFACDDPAAVDATYARLVGLGHHGHKEPWDAFWGQRYAVIHDPDGNAVDLFASLD